MSPLAPLVRGVASHLVRFAADARDLLFPPHCPGCGRSLPPRAEGALCPECRRDLPSPGEPLCPGCGIAAAVDASSFCPSCRGLFATDAVVFAAPFAGTARELVHRFKYRADFEAGRLLARLLAQRLGAMLPDGADLLVPVPLHRRRLGKRGFNQAALLARGVGRRLGVPVRFTVLGRARPTPVLAGLRPEERTRELRGAFRVRRPKSVSGRRVLLIDDVLTTGATAEGCCRALKEAGALWAGVAVAARVLLPLRRCKGSPCGTHKIDVAVSNHI